jgi:hypothetical protein
MFWQTTFNKSTITSSSNSRFFGLIGFGAYLCFICQPFRILLPLRLILPDWSNSGTPLFTRLHLCKLVALWISTWKDKTSWTVVFRRKNELHIQKSVLYTDRASLLPNKIKVVILLARSIPSGYSAGARRPESCNLVTKHFAWYIRLNLKNSDLLDVPTSRWNDANQMIPHIHYFGDLGMNCTVWRPGET